MGLVSALMSVMMLIFGVITFVIIMLLPAIIELKKPKDAGPKILENDEQQGINFLINIENDVKFDWTSIKSVVAEIIAILPSLEP